MIMCIHTWWVRTRSSTSSPVSASRTETVSVVGSPGATSDGTSQLDVESGVVGADRRDLGLLHDAHRGRIGMPMPSDQARTPFMPRSAWSVRLAQVNAVPIARATTATPTR